MLHIFRCYKPDEVYLYMSKEILALHEKDNRYLYCLDRLAERQKRSYKYEIIARPEMENVQEFDYFLSGFPRDYSVNYEKYDVRRSVIIEYFFRYASNEKWTFSIKDIR